MSAGVSLWVSCVILVPVERNPGERMCRESRTVWRHAARRHCVACNWQSPTSTGSSICTGRHPRRTCTPQVPTTPTCSWWRSPCVSCSWLWRTAWRIILRRRRAATRRAVPARCQSPGTASLSQCARWCVSSRTPRWRLTSSLTSFVVAPPWRTSKLAAHKRRHLTTTISTHCAIDPDYDWLAVLSPKQHVKPVFLSAVRAFPRKESRRKLHSAVTSLFMSSSTFFVFESVSWLSLYLKPNKKSFDGLPQTICGRDFEG